MALGETACRINLAILEKRDAVWRSVPYGDTSPSRSSAAVGGSFSEAMKEPSATYSIGLFDVDLTTGV